MTRKKYVELRKKRLKERDERFKRQREKARAKRLRKWTELVARRRRIEEQLEKARLEEERREKARDGIESAKTAVREVEKETEALVYVPEIMTEISKMLADADESLRSADYERAVKLSFEIKELVEKARLEASKRVEERKRAEEEERERRIEEKLLLEKRLEEERREEAKDAIGSVKTAVEEAEDKTKLSLYVPEITKKIDEMLTDAEKSFDLADYGKAIELSFGIRELVEKARLDASRKAEEKRKRRKEEPKYFYCVIPFSKEKSFGNIGLNNSEVYTIPYRDVAAVVSDSPMKDYELTEDNTRRHEKVLRQVMEEHTVVPVEFGTTIKNERILKRLLTKAYNPTRESLNLVDNMVELGAKILLNKDIVFVDPKKRKECVSDILASLNAKAKQAVTGDLFSDRLILNASFLVNKEDIDSFSDKVMKLQGKYPMLKLLYSGPWAPYNFVYIKIGTEGIEVTKK
ncbi:MAG: GvpL/GvpF family gas vesicle protein [Candidatus Bathyarchaeia archaeon]|nr:GvpL/GvpF family gas vesicle protein [Candidatus Bathyarchaeia archaeon]